MVDKVIGTGLGIFGQLASGSAQQAAGNYNRDVAYAGAVDAEREGAAQESRIRDAARQTIGQQVAAQGANGFQQGSGSAIDALTQSQVNAAMDALNARSSAASKARALRVQGDMAKAQGNNAMTASLIGAGSTAFRYATDWASAKAGQSPGYTPGGFTDPKRNT